MKSIKSNHFLLLVFFVVFLIALASGLFIVKSNMEKQGENLVSNITKEEDLYEYSWEMPKYGDLSLQKIKLSNVSGNFSVREGKVFHDESEVESGSKEWNRALRVALFYQVLREDPILISPAVNKDNVLAILEELKKEEDKIVARDQISAIYPTEFLTAFVDASGKYNSITEFSENNALDLVNDMSRVLDLYKKDIATFTTGLQNLKKTAHSQKKIAFLGGETYTSLQIMLDDLKMMNENSIVLGHQFKQLEKCLREDVNYCRRNVLEIEKPEAVSLNLQSEKIIFPEKNDLGLDGSKVYRGPYEINSFCWQRKEKQYLYLFTDCANGECKDISELADNAYYAKLMGMSKLDRELQANGIEIVPQRATTPYACNNLEYRASLITVDNFYLKYKDDRISKLLKKKGLDEKISGDVVQELQKAEDLFFDAKIPSENSLNVLREWYAYTYGVFANENVADEGVKNELLERMMLINGKLHNVEYILMGTVKNLIKHNVNMANVRIIPIYVYSVRSNYALFYLNFSSVIWRLQSHPQYMEHDDVAEDSENSGNILNYKEALDSYGEEKINAWSRKYFQINEDFYE